MKKGIVAATVLMLASIGLTAGLTAQQTPTRVALPQPNGPSKPVAAQTPDAYQEMLNKYCITCHNQKAGIPAGAPLALDVGES